MAGVVASVNILNRSGVPKLRMNTRVRVSSCGLEGDYHGTKMRKSHSKPGTMKPNFWQVSVLAAEVLQDLNADPDLKGMPELQFGSLGENLTVYNVGDLANLQKGDLIHVGPTLVLRVYEHMQPCSVIASAYHELLPKKLLHGKRNRRGVYCEVLGGDDVGEGDTVQVYRQIA